MIHAVIFDCFGVLTTDGWLAFRQRHFADNASRMREATDLNKQADAGFISLSEFEQAVAKLANISPESVRSEIDQNTANPELFQYIERELKPRYKIGMLSNAGRNFLPELFSQERIGLFDALAFSFELGAVKPEQRMYQAIAERLDVQPGECVFIDDQEKHCVGARDAGMQAIVYQDFAQMRRELEPLLADTKH